MKQPSEITWTDEAADTTELLTTKLWTFKPCQIQWIKYIVKRLHCIIRQAKTAKKTELLRFHYFVIEKEVEIQTKKNKKKNWQMRNFWNQTNLFCIILAVYKSPLTILVFYLGFLDPLVTNKNGVLISKHIKIIHYSSLTIFSRKFLIAFSHRFCNLTAFQML